MTSLRLGADGSFTDNILEPLLNSLPDIIHSVDKDGRIVFTNKRACELLGYTREELLNLNIFDLYAPEIREQVKRGFQKLQTKGDLAIRESLLATKSGQIIPVEVRSFGVYNEDGEFIRTFSMLRDIREMKEMRDNLMHAERLSGIGQLASCVVHDIHNPLMVIQLYTEMLTEDAPKIIVKNRRTEILESLAQIQKASEKIQKLLNHLRNFSRRESETREKVELNRIIGDALFMVMNKILTHSIRVVRVNQEAEYYCYGSSIQLEQVVMNLLSNACDAMRERAEKTLTVGIDEIEIEGKTYYRCNIRDTGCGIADENIDKIFTAFFTTKSKGQGTGLGLSICKDIVEGHGGKTDVQSKLGEGSCFRVSLPKYTGEDTPAA